MLYKEGQELLQSGESFLDGFKEGQVLLQTGAGLVYGL